MISLYVMSDGRVHLIPTIWWLVWEVSSEVDTLHHQV